jgi:hypothetical protein
MQVSFHLGVETAATTREGLHGRAFRPLQGGRVTFVAVISIADSLDNSGCVL